MKFDELLSLLQGKSTALVYDDPYAKHVFLDEIIRRKEGNLYYVIYSDTECRKQRVYAEEIAKIDEKLSEYLSRIKVIKIGFSDFSFNNNLYAFIREETARSIARTLVKLVRDIPGEAFIVYLGFGLMKHFHQDYKEVLRAIWSLCDDLKTNLFLFNKRNYEDYYSSFFDIVLRLETSEIGEIGLSRVYTLSIEKSVIPTVPPHDIMRIRNREFIEF
ncbi:hypothetical protein Ferp_1015 [Ferroglobus placidus DSM 10642]|uniref:KaiC-like domain-containing protein n=1 Tax=Ferroglobus placidus (strain DSM 10642 / AEDII12DO) TaxID=589924 RepID=D3RXG4_FERPA|nr:hypothetical protein [Ferroglobus placidus]ADC65177.1 hypothetical protein Ferp_1015 [Ferroglobus placidus DSM 10642]